MDNATHPELLADRPTGQDGPGRGFRLVLLNGFRVTDRGQSIAIPSGAQRLIVFLALSDRPVLRPYVAGNLWLDQPDHRSAANLRSVLWRIRRCHRDLVQTTGDYLQLASQLQIDLHDVTTMARRLVLGPSAEGDLSIDVAALSGDLLPEWCEDWVALEREHFRQLRLHALERLCERLTAAGRHGEAVLAGLRAVTGEFLRESAQTALIKAYLAEGNRYEAVRQYSVYRQALHRELDLEPVAEMEQLIAQACFHASVVDT